MVKVEPMKIIGKSIPIMEAQDKALGAFVFSGDVEAELYAKILRSPYAHAKVNNIDISKAEKLEGVEAIITYADVPRRLFRRDSARACYILEDHVRFVGDEIAAVAATSEAIAEQALELIEVDYEVLPAVFDPEEAAQPDAPKIYPEGNVYGPDPGDFVVEGTNAPTVCSWGDVNKGFEEADVVVEDSFEVKPQVHSPIEPRTCTALWKGEELTLWNSTQTPWELRQNLAILFDIPESRIRVFSQVGGGFGGKYVEKYQPIVALLAKKAFRRSVKLTLTREEEECQTKRANCKIHGKLGLQKDGTISALEFRLYFDLGGYGNCISGSCIFISGSAITTYKAGNARWEAWDVHTNRFTSQCCRSVHWPAVAFGVEQLIDEGAEKLGLDPLEVRMKNLPDTDEKMPPKPWVDNPRGCTGEKLDIYPAKKLLEMVAEKIDWKRWKGWGKPIMIDGPKRRGISIVCLSAYIGYYYDGFMSEKVCINRDGSVIIYTGTQDLGTGSNTTLRMIAAESLGLCLEDVAIVTGDTSTGQYDYMNARASHELTTGGHILLLAIEEAKQKIRESVAPLFDVKPEDIEIAEKKAYVKGHPGKAKPLRELLTSVVTGSATGPQGSISPSVRPGYEARQPVVQAAEVEVDIETGQVKPIKMVVGNFPGRMINPGIVKGQNEGGGMMSMGMALFEECKFDEKTSACLSKDFTDYRIPRALDIPEIETVMLEEVDESPPYEGLPYGARGIGEMSAWGGPAVYANAVYNAIGIRTKISPMTAERILETLEEEKADK